MSRVLTMSGSPLGSTWDWKKILGAVAGGGAIAGGGILAYQGWKRSAKTRMWLGLGLAGAGIATIVVCWWMARVSMAVQTDGYRLQPPANREVREGDQVYLGDGERGTVETVDVLADGSRQLSVMVDGQGGMEGRIVDASEVRIVS